jgi:hypothetical protein
LIKEIRVGEAKRNAKLLGDWKNSLSDEERTVFDISSRLHINFIKPRNVTGMCYHSVFFLYIYLKRTHGIITTPTIGYVNDGTDDIFISHAWLEFNGKRIDVSLAVTDPKIGKAGELLILDRVMKAGHQYGYYFEIPERGIKQHELLKMTSTRALLERKEREHTTMASLVNHDDEIVTYLNNEPNGFDLQTIASLI